MTSVFPLDPENNDTYQGYYWDGEFWKKQGIDLTENYLEESSASATYLTKVNASTTYLTQTSASSTYAPLSGAILQTQLSSVTASQSISSTSFVALTNLFSTITPKYATSKILITMSISGYSPNATNGHFAIYRGGTQLVSEAYVSYQAGEFFHHTMYFIDTPGSISTHTYQGYAKKNLSGDNDFTVSYGDSGGQTRSTIMVQEIAV